MTVCVGGNGGAGVPGAPGARGIGAGGPDAADARPAFTLAADGSYAARLAPREIPAEPSHGAGEPAAGAARAWFVERWTLDGHEPYAVPLPLDQPEEPDSDVLPLTDGRVLIRRRVADRHAFSLLYPTGPGTGELALGTLACAELTMLPPSPDGIGAYALSAGARSTSVWMVAGGVFGPERVAEVPGHCTGGVWLDGEGRLLALDRRPPDGGPVKAVVVDLGRGGEVAPLLQITPDSDDRLLLADPGSGLLLIRSDAPGQDRLGWGVLGSRLPVRFPECLRPAEATVTPFAVQPGQLLTPENCAVALRIDGAAGSWLGLWRPSGRRLHQRAAPGGWQAGRGTWTRDGLLRLPYADAHRVCGVALVEAPVDIDPGPPRAAGAGTESGRRPSAAVAPLPVRRPVPGALSESGAVRRTGLSRIAPEPPLVGRGVPGADRVAHRVGEITYALGSDGGGPASGVMRLRVRGGGAGEGGWGLSRPSGAGNVGNPATDDDAGAGVARRPEPPPVVPQVV